jgi:uncharacterized membrane protein
MRTIKQALAAAAFLFAFCAYSFAQVQGDVSLSNGAYENITSVNSGIVFVGTAKNSDYRLDSGVLATTFEKSNNDIVFSSPTPSESSVSSSTVVSVGINIKTFQGKLRQVRYRISCSTNLPNPNDSFFTVFTDTFSDSSSGTGFSEKYFEVADINFQPGINYIQWYAQNSNSDEGNIGTFIVRVEDSGGYVKILKPSGSVPLRPEIKADIYSPLGFQESSVTVKMYVGNSTTTGVMHNIDYGGGRFVSLGQLEYVYSGNALESETRYTLYIEMQDSGGNTFSNAVVFDTIGRGISQLLPYPSPYNPKSGKPMKIRYIIDENSEVSINIYDRAGKLVSRVLQSENRSAGINTHEWEAKSYAGDNLANGVYICEIIVKGSKEDRRYCSFAILRK